MLLRRVVSSPMCRLPFRCLSSSGNGNGNGNGYYETMTMNLNETVTGARIDHSLDHAPIYYTENTFNEHKHRLDLKKMNGGTVDLEKDDESGFSVVTISNPSKGNAMSGSMMSDLSDIVDELEEWRQGKAVILRGSPDSGVFCAGGDLKMVKTMLTPNQGSRICLFMQNTLNRLMQLPLLSVAVIHGAAIGGGAELVTACDFRLMTRDARIQFPQARLGITPGWGGGRRLVRLVGPKTALKILTSGRVVSSHEALELDLADGVVDGADVVSSASEWLQQYTRGATEVIQATKCVVLAGAELPLDAAMRKEKDLFSTVWGGPAHVKALNKVMKKD